MPDLVDFHALFTQLQNRYPSSSLVSELIQIHEGHFVVRAVVEVSGVPLATAMAAALAIEQAEDQARVRVLKLLGIQAAVAGMATLPASNYELQAQLLSSTLDKSLDKGVLPTSGDRKAPKTPEPLPSLPDLQESLQSLPAPPMSFETKGKVDLPPASLFEPEPLPEVSKPAPRSSKAGVSAAANGSSDRAASTRLATDRDPAPEPTVASPTDLSELITLTDIEIQRVGWTRKQGHDHLVQTYGKKKRADLDQEQLLEFLHYLKALPSRYDSPFRE